MPGTHLVFTTNFETPFASPTNVGSDGDLYLLLTVCQNDFLVLSACSAAARPLALCISAFLRHFRNEYLKYFFVSVMFLCICHQPWVYCKLPKLPKK